MLNSDAIRLFPIAIFLPLFTGLPVLADPVGIYCAQGGNQVLVARPVAGGIEFLMSFWNSNGHACNAGGIAAPDDAGWTLEDGGCAITLSETDDGVLLSARPDEACAQFCGARASMAQLEFPATGKVSSTADPAFFERGLMEMPPGC